MVAIGFSRSGKESEQMNITSAVLIVILVFVFTMGAPAKASSECKVYSIEDWKESKECPKIARMYVTGDKDDAVRLAKELLPSVEHIYTKRHNVKNPDEATYDFGAELSMLQAVIKDDQQQVKEYMENDYDAEEDGFYGFKVGLDQALAVYKKSMQLTAAEPLYGRLSSRYLNDGELVVALSYASGHKDEAKELAKQLLPLAQNEKIVLNPDPAVDRILRKDKEGFLNGILNDDKDVIVYHSSSKNRSATFVALDSSSGVNVGEMLENAYGRIYLHKKFSMYDRLPYDYCTLGNAQAIAGNYDESDRAYKMALILAGERYGESSMIRLWIKSSYAAMLTIAGKVEASKKLADGLTPEYAEKVQAKAHADFLKHPVECPPAGWGP